MMKDIRVLALTRYGHLGASSRLRTYQYLPFLKKHGIDVEVVSLLDNDYIKELYSGKRRGKIKVFCDYFRRLKQIFSAKRFNLLWIEKELFPFLPAWGEFLLDTFGISYVVDYDDAVFHNYDNHPNKLVRSFLKNKIDLVMKWADCVIVGNDYLGDRALQAGAKRIEYLPTVIDLEKYQVATRPQETSFTIGWIGSPATAGYIQFVQPALSEICKDGQTRVVLVGSGPVKLADVPVEILPWTEDSEVAAIQNFDVGIMPLPDEPWTRGKCGYKLIQYMACGLPVVASPVGINLQIVEHGVNGFLASDIADWVNALRKLCDSAPLREAMGRAGRYKVEKQYCIQVTVPRLAKILLSAAK
jgi:glycosyltransferase involved in cell wall biosynthesis